MQSKTILVAALVGSAHAIFDIAPRQNTDVPALNSGCLSAALALQSDLPKIPTDLVSALASLTSIDPCHFTPPPNVAAEYSSYAKSAESWASKHSAQLESLASSCGGGIQTGGTNFDCTSAANGSNGGSKTTAGSGSGSKTTGGSSGASATGGSGSSGNSGSGSSSAGSSGAAATTSASGKSAGSRAEIALGAVLGAGLLAAVAL